MPEAAAGAARLTLLSIASVCVDSRERHMASAVALLFLKAGCRLACEQAAGRRDGASQAEKRLKNRLSAVTLAVAWMTQSGGKR